MSDDFTPMRPKHTFLYDGFVDLCDTLKKNGVRKILEIGAYAGESCLLFKTLIPGSIVISVDPWDVQLDDLDHIRNQSLHTIEQKFNVTTRSVSNYGKLKFYSQDIVSLFADGYFDLVYIDGLHTYEQVKLDINLYYPKVNVNGFIGGHDYDIEVTDISDFPGNKSIRENVSRAVNEVLDVNKIKTFKDTSWLFKKEMV